MRAASGDFFEVPEPGMNPMSSPPPALLALPSLPLWAQRHVPSTPVSLLTHCCCPQPTWGWRELQSCSCPASLSLSLLPHWQGTPRGLGGEGNPPAWWYWYPRWGVGGEEKGHAAAQEGGGGWCSYLLWGLKFPGCCFCSMAQKRGRHATTPLHSLWICPIALGWVLLDLLIKECEVHVGLLTC